MSTFDNHDRDCLPSLISDTRIGFRHLIALAPLPLAASVVLAVLSAALSLAPFVFLYWMALEIFRQRVDVSAVRTLALYALLSILVRWALMGLSHAFAHIGAFTVLYRLRLALTRKFAQVPMSFFAQRRSGELRRVVLNDTGSLEGFLAHMLPDAVAAVMVPLLALGLLSVMDWRLTLASLVPLPLALGLQWLLMRKSSRHMQRWQAIQDNVAAQLVEYLRGIPVVKLFGLTSRSFGDLARTIGNAVRWVNTYATGAAASWAAFVALLGANLIVVAPLGVWLHARGEVEAATVILFLLVAPAVLQPLLRLVFAASEQNRRRQALTRVDAILRAPVLCERIGATPPSTAAMDIEFEQVSFRYTEDAGQTVALHDVTFHACTGGVTALVGPSGAGKSTALRLLSRFYDVSSGSIRLGGMDLRDWPLDALLAQLGIVQQEVILFHGSVRDNLRIAAPDADDDALIAAAQAARAHAFIQDLPQGYDTAIGDRGARLSGGERQRLSIARALLKNAPILLLDEATAFADAENELLIQQALDTVCHGRTVLMVAHRLHTVRDADHIVVFDRGGIAGQGKHEALLRDCAVYRQLWRDHEQARDWQLGAHPIEEATAGAAP